jgi:hypothetical protein
VKTFKPFAPSEHPFSIKLYIAPPALSDFPTGDIYTEVFACDLENALRAVLERMKVENYSAIVIRRKA